MERKIYYFCHHRGKDVKRLVEDLSAGRVKRARFRMRGVHDVNNLLTCERRKRVQSFVRRVRVEEVSSMIEVEITSR